MRLPLAAAAATLLLGGGLQAQAVPPELARERAEYAAFLAREPLSPYAALAQQPLGRGLVLGAGDADIVVPGLARLEVRATAGGATLQGGAAPRAVVRDVPVVVGGVRLLLGGVRERPTLAVYGTVRVAPPPAYFPFDAAERFDVTLVPPAAPGPVTLLGPDGLESVAAEAGTVALPGGAVLRVRSFDAGHDERELEIYFRDATNGAGSYPAGRFVSLLPLGGGRYRLDFNRARNPYCAYNTVFPCPAPWPGNALARPVAAGERYAH